MGKKEKERANVKKVMQKKRGREGRRKRSERR